uniref:Spermatogenesis-associated protein 31E1-like n=1 Tax=Castor canadensis TaxID=51338 RepID=A0A8B7UE60_CASCN|nr:spermatogenesis-associated protein 31E1-like [Castor canadensis]
MSASGEVGPEQKRKKTGNLKVTRDCIRKTEEIQNVVLILESRLEKLHDEEGLHELLHADTTSEVLRTGPTTEQWTPRQSVGNPFPNTFSPLPSQAPLTQGQLPLVSPLSVEHQEDQSDLKRIPLGTVPQSSGPGTSYLTSIIRNNSGLDPCNHPISILFWWWATAKALLFPSWAHAKNQECLSPLPPEATLGDPTHWQTEAGGLSFLEPNVQKHLESLITKRADLKLWEKTDKKGSFFQPTNPDYPLDSPGNLVKLKGNPQNTGSNSFWTRKGRPQALPSSQQHSYSIDLGNIVQEKCIQLFWGPPSLHSESLVATAWVHNRSSSAQPKAVAFNKVSNSLPVQHQAEGPPQLFCAEQLPQEVAQPQLWRQSMSPSVVQIQTCSSPSQPPSSSQIRSCIITSSRSQHKAQSLTPNEDQNLECPWQKQLKWKKVLASKFQNSQEAIRQPTLNHPTGSQDTHTTKSTPRYMMTAPSAFIRLASQELKQPEDKFPEKHECQAKDKHGPFQPIKPSDLTGESSKGIQKVGSHTLEDHLRKV